MSILMSIFVPLMTVARLLTALLVCATTTFDVPHVASSSANDIVTVIDSVIRIVRQWKEPASPTLPYPTLPYPLYTPTQSPRNDALKDCRLIKGPGDILLTFVKFLPNKISTSRAHKTAAAAHELKRCVFQFPPKLLPAATDGTCKDQVCHLSGRAETVGSVRGSSWEKSNVN